MTPEDAFAIYLDYAPELEFLNSSDSEDDVFSESMLAIVPEAENLEIFLDEAGELYDLAKREFINQIIKSFENTLNQLVGTTYKVSTRRPRNIEGNHGWRFRDESENLFEVGFYFEADKGKCIATPWFWGGQKKINLSRDQQADKLKSKFSFPHIGNWYPGALVAKPVEYHSGIDIKVVNRDLISPIKFAVRKVFEHIER